MVAVAERDWLERTLDEIVSRIRRLFDITACAFVVIDWEQGEIRPAAAWFASEDVRAAMTPVLHRAYDDRRPGLTETAIAREGPLLVARIEEWPSAGPLRERLREQLSPEAAQLTWDWYRGSSFLACPVTSPAGDTLGVLTVATSPPHRALGEDDLRTAEVFADLAGLALERSQLLSREARRSHEELLLGRAAQEMSRSLEPEVVYRAIVDQAAIVTGVSKMLLTRLQPGGGELRAVATRGFSARTARGRFRVGEGMIGRVAETGEAYLSRPGDRESFLGWVVDNERIASFAHVPIAIGPRLFGVLTASDERPDGCDTTTLGLLRQIAAAAAAAIANALDFQRERRVARALTSGFVPGLPEPLQGFEVGLVYEPTGHEAGGGDFFGLWQMSSGNVAVLIGDVSGKGLEVASTSAMVRFFIEARTWECDRPAEVLRQVNAALLGRLPRASLVTAFLAVVDGSRLRWCNAGHPPPVLLPAAGAARDLTNTGLPLGVERDGRYRESESELARGDLLFASTDGLSEARRDGVYFGDARLGPLLAEHGRELDPESLARLMHHEAEEWARRLEDDVVVLALRRS